MTTPQRAFYERQIHFLERLDLDGLMSQYAVDAALLGYGVDVRGKEAIHEHMRAYLAHLEHFKLISTDQYAESDDSLMFEATVKTALGVVQVYDIFLLRGDLLYRHYTGLIGVQPA